MTMKTEKRKSIVRLGCVSSDTQGWKGGLTEEFLQIKPCWPGGPYG